MPCGGGWWLGARLSHTQSLAVASLCRRSQAFWARSVLHCSVLHLRSSGHSWPLAHSQPPCSLNDAVCARGRTHRVGNFRGSLSADDGASETKQKSYQLGSWQLDIGGRLQWLRWRQGGSRNFITVAAERPSNGKFGRSPLGTRPAVPAAWVRCSGWARSHSASLCHRATRSLYGSGLRLYCTYSC